MDGEKWILGLALVKMDGWREYDFCIFLSCLFWAPGEPGTSCGICIVLLTEMELGV